MCNLVMKIDSDSLLFLSNSGVIFYLAKDGECDAKQ